MNRQNISENLSSWIRAISGAIGVLLLLAFILWNNENEKSSTLTQETKTNEMRKVENLSTDEAESIKNQETEIITIRY
jgi:FtsZ-interacting cell division protein ZipA